MRTIFAMILKLIVILLAVLTIFATVFVLFFLSFNRILLNPQTYKQAFTENKVNEQLPAVTADEFELVKNLLTAPCAESVIANSCLDQAETSRLGVEATIFIHALNPDQWNKLVSYLLPQTDLQAGVETTAEELIAYFKGETDTVKMPLTSLKARLTGMTDQELNSLLLNSQPPCTLEQQTLIMSDGIGGTGSPPIFCSATGGTSQALSIDHQRRLDIVVSEIPEHIIFIESPSPANPAGLQRLIGKDLRETLQRIHANSQYLPFVPFVLLLIVAAFGVRSLRGLLRWWGIPIFIASLLTLILGIVVFFMFDWIWLNYILTHYPPILTSGFGDLIYGVTHSVTNDLSQRIMIEAGIITLLSLVVILISNRVPPPPDPSLPPLAQPGTPGGPVLNPDKKKKRW